jgi:hypothetical protein
MSTKPAQELSSIDAGAPARSIDLEDVRPVAVEGGTVVFAQSHRETPHGAQISAGEVPVCVAGVYSPKSLRASLDALGYDSEAIARALRHPLDGETATRAVRCAEREAGHTEVLA